MPPLCPGQLHSYAALSNAELQVLADAFGCLRLCLATAEKLPSSVAARGRSPVTELGNHEPAALILTDI